MSTYVEVHCDVRTPGRDPAQRLSSFCWSDRNDNPQAGSVGRAKAQARKQGWTLTKGNRAACPNCSGKHGEPFWYPIEDQSLLDRPCRTGCDNPECCSVRCCGPLSTLPARLTEGEVA